MSYRIITASDVVCDSTNPANGVINPVLKQTVNKVWSFEFTMPPGHPFYSKIIEQKTEIGVQLDGNDPIFWGTVIEQKTDFYGQKTVYVEDMLGYFNYALMPPHRYNSQNITEILTVAVTQYNAQCTDKPITLGNVTTTHTAHNLGWSSNYETVLDMLMANVIGKNGGYIRMRYDPSDGKRYLDYSEDYGSTRQVIRIGSNLIDFIRDSDASELVSVLIPLGARLPDDEQTVEGVDLRLTIETDQRQTDRIEDNTLILEIGRKVKARIWDSVEDPDDLYNIGVDYLANQFKDVTIEAKAFDLNLADEQIDSIRLYDEVRIISEPHNLDTRFPVMELTMNLNNPANNVLTLGKTVQPSITQTTIESAEKLDNVPTYVDVQTEAAKRAAEVLESATNGYIKFVYNDNTGVLEQILIKDLTDPDNNWWRIGLGGIGYTSDGGQSYDVAMTRLGQLVSYFAIIGGWEVNSEGLYKTVADPLDATKQYRVTIYTPNAQTPGTSPVFDFTVSNDGGQSWEQNFYIPGNGSLTVYCEPNMSPDNPRLSFVNKSNPSQIRTLLNDRYITVFGITGQTPYFAQMNPYNVVLGTDNHGTTLLSAHDGFEQVLFQNGAYVGLGTILNQKIGLKFYDANGDLSASYPNEGWEDKSVTDNHANGGTTTWKVLRNGQYVMAICRREFTGIEVNYQWGGIWCGYSSQQYPLGTDCNFKTCLYPVVFESAPTVIAQIEAPNGGSDGWLVTNGRWTQSDKTRFLPAYDMARGGNASASVSSIAIDYIVFGKARTIYTISYSLTDVTSSNTSVSVYSDYQYATTLTPAQNYAIDTVTVLMGGIDVTDDYYDPDTGIIQIPNVTGNISITAVALDLPDPPVGD